MQSHVEPNEGPRRSLEDSIELSKDVTLIQQDLPRGVAAQTLKHLLPIANARCIASHIQHSFCCTYRSWQLFVLRDLFAYRFSDLRIGWR